jgi:hypothetical protein
MTKINISSKSYRSLAKVVPSTPFSRFEPGKLFHPEDACLVVVFHIINYPAEVFTINCTARELKEVPTSGHAFEADALLLADNKISHLDFSFLKSFPSLKVLVVKKNGLKSITKSGKDNFILNEVPIGPLMNRIFKL